MSNSPVVLPLHWLNHNLLERCEKADLSYEGVAVVRAGEESTSQLCLEDDWVAEATRKRSPPSMASNPADDCASQWIKSPGRCGEPL